MSAQASWQPLGADQNLRTDADPGCHDGAFVVVCVWDCGCAACMLWLWNEITTISTWDWWGGRPPSPALGLGPRCCGI